jgi:hypothetical protein
MVVFCSSDPRIETHYSRKPPRYHLMAVVLLGGV